MKLHILWILYQQMRQINVVSTVPVIYQNKSIRCKMDILLAFLLIIIVLFIITFGCRYHTNGPTQKYVGTLAI